MWFKASAAAQRGFTLIEMIGVMAVMAILASAIAPSVFDDIKRARRDKESAQLEVLAEHLEHYILDNKRIPQRATASWTAAIATMASLTQTKIEFNERGFRRAYFVDPRFFTNSDTAFPGYVQQGGLTTPVVSPRIMLVSVLTANAPAAPTTNAAFSAIWDQSAGATVVESDDVKIERINLKSAFHRVVLSNEQAAQTAYQLENGSQNAVPAAAGGIDGVLTRYVLSKTRINLYSEPFPGGALDQVVVADNDKNYAYQQVGAQWMWARP